MCPNTYDKYGIIGFPVFQHICGTKNGFVYCILYSLTKHVCYIALLIYVNIKHKQMIF